jgi:hypothetical protein
VKRACLISVIVPDFYIIFVTHLLQAFFAKMIREGVQVRATRDLAMHLCWESERASRMFLSILREGFTKLPTDQLGPYFKVLTSVLNLKDSLQVWRVDTAMCFHLKNMEVHIGKKENVDIHVIYLSKLSKKNELVKLWMLKHKDALNEVITGAGFELK